MKLLSLFLGEGIADIMTISYILAEKQANTSWFPEDNTIVTKDVELTKIATSHDIKCVSDIP